MIKKLKIGTVIFHSLIIIGVGHGIAFLLFDIVSIPGLVLKELSLNTHEFKGNFASLGIISSLGKFGLIISLFLKSRKKKRIFEVTSILLLWISIFFVILGSKGFIVLLWSTIPFFICISALTFLVIKNTRNLTQTPNHNT